MPRKLIEFHAEDLLALTELAEDRSTSLQELVDEAIRDVLKKHGRPTDLKTALRDSAKQSRNPRKS
ncbi:hypothetical protein [Pseudorhodoplanes sp.]|uniref:hypothetical protein n=1 Tax=Pseudorhodoplanes sp. TaxID=1934341 RepID=UPI002CFB6058|nr:hypothetical protein [Pseudorhodoplanes sp.]HWV54482.1 hypothetical protein [Pseudorhodoplanes sp.]